MENMLTRLRKVFLDSGESQTSIAKKTNVTSAYIWKILNNDDVRPRDLFIDSVCREFNINEEWIRTGNGEMLKRRSKSQEIGSFVNDIMDLPDENFKKRFISALTKLHEDDWAVLMKIADELNKEG